MSKGMFGECLKREREMREVSLEEICAATRISTRFLQAMENEDWEKLPGGVFNRGFVRSVSRYLGLDEEGMLAEYDVAFSEHAPPVPVLPPQPIPRSLPGWFPFLILLLFAVFIAGTIYGWRHFSFLHRARSAPPAQKPAPIVAASAPIRTATSGNAPTSSEASSADPRIPKSSNSSSDSSSALDLSVAIAITTQVRIAADGKILYDGLLSAGEIRHFRARNQLDVAAGDSGGVLLELNGQTMPPLGTPGSPGKISLTWKDLKKEPGGTN